MKDEKKVSKENLEQVEGGAGFFGPTCFSGNKEAEQEDLVFSELL